MIRTVLIAFYLAQLDIRLQIRPSSFRHMEFGFLQARIPTLKIILIVVLMYMHHENRLSTFCTARKHH
uniref:Uncharacterized protein n=1 Tax=Oryza brachyantha TaxID=4533 RepID=J3N169_ORYBR